MRYLNTRDENEIVNIKEAIINGLAKDGGLYVPEHINKIDDIYKLKDYSYQELANFILNQFIDYDISEYVNKAYNSNFDNKNICPVKKVGNNYFLELFHGPTSAFKDVALQLLPYILTSSSNDDKDIVILSATSGDTGKAALEGFKDVGKTRITILYPNKMVSKVQERQMTTTKGNNTDVIAVNGNFDDCQSMVKDILENHKSDKIHLTSANSINIARLLPQIVYYFSAYFELLNNNEITKDELLDYYVPTGNFGDILAGYIAKEMGLPINKLICSSNSNNVLTDFINTGTYDINRDFINTMEPSIDILISSNLERLLYLKSKDTNLIKELMSSLKTNKKYTIPNSILTSIQEDFVGIYASEEEVKEAIKEVYEKDHYLIDPHTAVAYIASKKYDTKHKKVILATASPYKFSKDVYKCLTNEDIVDNLEAIETLENCTNIEAPSNLKELKDLPIRFREVFNLSDKDLLIKKLEKNND